MFRYRLDGYWCLMTKLRSVKFNAVMNTLLTASNMIVNLITVPYVTRVLSVEGYGKHINVAICALPDGCWDLWNKRVREGTRQSGRTCYDGTRATNDRIGLHHGGPICLCCEHRSCSEAEGIRLTNVVVFR